MAYEQALDARDLNMWLSVLSPQVVENARVLKDDVLITAVPPHSVTPQNLYFNVCLPFRSWGRHVFWSTMFWSPPSLSISSLAILCCEYYFVADAELNEAVDMLHSIVVSREKFLGERHLATGEAIFVLGVLRCVFKTVLVMIWPNWCLFVFVKLTASYEKYLIRDFEKWDSPHLTNTLTFRVSWRIKGICELLDTRLWFWLPLTTLCITGN